MEFGPRVDLNAREELEMDLAVALISDSNYLSRCATALSSSNASEHSHVLGLDQGIERLTSHFPSIHVNSFQQFLSGESKVSSSVANRSRAEQIFSIGPSFLLTLSERVRKGGWLVYMDSDLYFLKPLESYLGDLPFCNVVIAPHRHYRWNKNRLAKYGMYNVGLVAFRKNEEGLRALRFWAESCIDWCYDRAEDGKYADQKYLEQFASVSEGVFVDNSLGANLAPWNSFLKRISATKTGDIFVSRDKLIYFHAQGLKQKSGRWILGHLNFLSFAGPRLKKLVYGPYLAKLEEWSQKPGFEGFGTSRTPTTLLGRLAASLMYSLSLLTGQTIKIGTTRSGAQE
jgi:hypothetical protein